MFEILNSANTLAQTQDQGGGAGGAIIGIVYLGVIIVAIAGLWKTFSKAGQPGWGAIIPFLNIYLMCKIAGRPGWWFILMLIPFVNFIVGIILSIDIAKAFGKGTGFGLGLAFLGFIFFPILGFSDAQYLGEGAADSVPVNA